jgi:hypothetical protein
MKPESIKAYSLSTHSRRWRLRKISISIVPDKIIAIYVRLMMGVNDGKC